MGIERAVCHGLVVDALLYREIGGFADGTIDEISAGANELLALDYEKLVGHGTVSVHGLNRLRRVFGRPLRAPAIGQDELIASLNTLQAADVVEFVHFSSDARGRKIAPSAYALIHEIPLSHEPEPSSSA